MPDTRDAGQLWFPAIVEIEPGPGNQVLDRAPAPGGEISDAERIALAVAQASMGVPSDRQFLGLIAMVLPGWFPHLPCQ